MDEIREQMEHTKEIADAISNPVNVGVDVDEVTISITGPHINDTQCRNRILLRTNLLSWNKRYLMRSLRVRRMCRCMRLLGQVPWRVRGFLTISG